MRYFFNKIHLQESDIKKHIREVKKLKILTLKEYADIQYKEDLNSLDVVANIYYGSYLAYLDHKVKNADKRKC